MNASFLSRLPVLIAAVLAMAESTLGVEIRHRLPAAPGADSIQQNPRDVPVTCQADVVVAGGGVAGVAAALRAAADGCSVALVEERNCLGCEAATEWTLVADGSKIGPQSPTAARLLAALGGPSEGRNKRVRPDPCKKVLHRLVAEQTRIRVFFYSLSAGVVLEQGRVRGLVVANRAGRQVFSAKAVVDATGDQRAAAAAGARFVSASGPRIARRLIAVDPLPGAAIRLPAANFSDCATAPWQGLLVLTCKISPSGDAAADWSNAQATTLDRAIALRELLTASGRKPKTFVVSPEVSLVGRPAVRRAAPEVPRPAGVEGLALAEPPAAPNSGEVILAGLLTSGEAAGRVAAEMARAARGALETQDKAGAAKAPAGQVRELLAGPDAGIRYPVLRQGPVSLPVSAETDVLVIGGGTSGSFAAIAAGRQGLRVIVVDSLPNLGGTSSNRVHGYYWGVPWKSQLSEDVDLPSGARRNASKSGLGKMVFSGEEKKVVLQQLAAGAGVTIRYRSLGAGAVVEANRVVGAVIEDASGRHVIRAKVVIDATGQGDIAAAAGAAFHVGRPSDGFLHEAEHGPLRDALDPEDISKVYLRTPPGTLSLNIRESRRIEGDYMVTLSDVLTGRRFPDLITRWRSNYDTHFPHSANEDDTAQDWAAILGLFRKPLWGSIPYRAILPKGLENLLVVGKAYSTTHDALIGGRMQRDLQHLGEAAGVAAAMACRNKTPLRAVPIDKLQDELVRLGVLLPEDASEAHIAPTSAPRVDLAATAARLGTDQALDAMVELYLAGGVSAEYLLPLLKSPDEARRTQAALLLGMFGRREAVPVLLERLRERDRRTVVFTLPNASSHCSVPLYYSAVVLLGRQRVREAAGPIAALLADPKSCPPDLASFAIVALGRIGDRSLIPAITPYLNLTERVSLLEENRRFEVQWGVRTNAARTLARLGDYSGVPVLIELLEADQSRLRNYAQCLLEEISGRRYGKDRQAWQRWWQQQQGAGVEPPPRRAEP